MHALSAGLAAAWAGTALDDCNGTEPKRTISGCDAMPRGDLNPGQRAVALVRRGEAHEKLGDLGAAIMSNA